MSSRVAVICGVDYVVRLNVVLCEVGPATGVLLVIDTVLKYKDIIYFYTGNCLFSPDNLPGTFLPSR